MTKMLANLKLWQKFAVIGGIVAIMVTVPVVKVISSGWAAMDAAKSEIAGLVPANSVIHLIKLTQQHRGLSAAMLGGDTTAPAKREAAQAEVERTLAEIKVQVVALNSGKISERLDRIGHDWQSVVSAVASKSISAKESFTRQTVLVETEQALLNDVAESSGLALDPEANTYYLMLAAISNLPKLTELFGTARAKGALILARGEPAPTEQAMLGSLAEQMQHDLAEARDSIERAGSNDC